MPQLAPAAAPLPVTSAFALFRVLAVVPVAGFPLSVTVAGVATRPAVTSRAGAASGTIAARGVGL